MTYEMPVVARLSREELARALYKPVDHPDIALLGGLNVVIHPMDSPHVPSASALADAMPHAANEIASAAEALGAIEEKLFERLRNPNTARQFLLDPMGTLDRLGLVDEATRAKLEAHAAVLTAAIAPG
jgi:hypothetical protein